MIGYNVIANYIIIAIDQSYSLLAIVVTCNRMIYLYTTYGIIESSPLDLLAPTSQGSDMIMVTGYGCQVGGFMPLGNNGESCQSLSYIHMAS